MPRTKADLDAYADAAARMIAVEIAPEWRPGVIEHLAIILANADLVGSFALPEDIEPAPVYSLDEVAPDAG